MDDVRNLQTSKVNLTDTPELVARVFVNLLADVREDSVVLTLADVEGLAVARINQPVDVRLELLCHFGRERGQVVGHAPIVLRSDALCQESNPHGSTRRNRVRHRNQRLPDAALAGVARTLLFSPVRPM